MRARLSGRAGIATLAVAFLALAAVLWWAWLSPARDLVAERDSQLRDTTVEANHLHDTVTRLRAERPAAAARTAERLRLAKALPADEQVPAALVQLQDLADRSGVEIRSISARGAVAYGELSGTGFEIAVSGRFHDVDDFLYRLHNQVTVDERRRPVVTGRLFALRTVALSVGADNQAGGSGAARVVAGTAVTATVEVIAYMAPVDGGPDAGPPPAAPAPPAFEPDGPTPDPAPDPAPPAAGDAPAIAESPAGGGAG